MRPSRDRVSETAAHHHSQPHAAPLVPRVGDGYPATVAVPDADIPRIGGALFDDGGDTGVGVIHWYRQGTYNRVTGDRCPLEPLGLPRGHLLGVDPFSFYIEGSTAGARLVIRNSAGYGRVMRLWVFTAAGNLV